MRETRGITSLVAFGVSVLVGLVIALIVNPVFASQGNLPNPIPGGFSTAFAGSLISLALLLVVQIFAFAPILAAEMLAVKGGNLHAAMEALVILVILAFILFFILMDGVLIIVSLMLAVPTAVALASKIPIDEEKKKRPERFTWS